MMKQVDIYLRPWLHLSQHKLWWCHCDWSAFKCHGCKGLTNAAKATSQWRLKKINLHIELLFKEQQLKRNIGNTLEYCILLTA